MTQYIGDMVSYANCTLTIRGKEYAAKAVSYGDSINRSDVEGASRMSLGQTQGSYTTDEATFELYASEHDRLLADVGEGFYDVEPFEITNAYEKVGTTQMQTDTLVKCRPVKRTGSDSAGSDAMTRTLTVKPLYIKFAGKNPLKPMPKGLQ